MFILKSDKDASVNFVETSSIGALEARYVKRPNTDYFCVYVSSHYGCNKACRFCHLTSSGQTSMKAVDLDGYLEQVREVLTYAEVIGNKDETVHINYMARGEPLSNPTMLIAYRKLYRQIQIISQEYGIKTVKHNVSTIMPRREIEYHNLEDVFEDYAVNLYYSLYSVSPEFRKKWIPKSLNPYIALHKIEKLLINNPQNNLIIHFPLIEDQNDSEKDIDELLYAVAEIVGNYNPRFNLVRFNSNNPKYRESKRYNEVISQIGEAGFNVRLVQRVGEDVYASCGTFVPA